MKKSNLPETAHITGARSEMAHGERVIVTLNGEELSLEESLEHIQKSPTGFNWGYGGSGPSQLAFEMCRKLYGKKVASHAFQVFNWKYIAEIKTHEFDMEIDLRDFNKDLVEQIIENIENGIY